MPRLLTRMAAGLIVSAGILASEAAAATFTVEPTQIVLSGGTSSVLLTLKNESSESLRFELSVFSWSQSPTGEMQLQPTDDIVFFPALLTIAPGESRRVRVGSATTRETREKTYRIFVEELPPLHRETSGVRVLTKMGIPIFLTPAKPIATATLNSLALQEGTIHFTLNNDGTVHFLPAEIHVRAHAGSSIASESEVNGWYVLAGGRRDFSTPISTSKCADITSVTVEVKFGSDLLQERLQTPNGVCPR